MSNLGDELVQSMAQALTHAQRKRARSRVRKVAIRRDSESSQGAWASQDQSGDTFGISASTPRKQKNKQSST
jgi:putative transcriptional regulator